MNPDFSALEGELSRLREQGYNLQKDGQALVRIAESGSANIADYKNTFATASGVLGNSSAVQESLKQFNMSGILAVSALHTANQTLSSTRESIYLSSISALSGVTFSNIASQSLIEVAIEAAPADKKDVFIELAKKRFEPPFSEEQLDILLSKFREDLPGRRKGAWHAFYSSSEDALAQAAHSMRDILATIVSKLGSNERVLACRWFDPSKKPCISDRVRLLLYGSESSFQREEVNFITTQIEDFISHDGSLKKVAHGSQNLNRDQVHLGMQKTEELLYLILSRSETSRADNLFGQVAEGEA